MAALEDVVMISACRTAVGKFLKSLSDWTASKLEVIAVREAVKRANVDPAKVGECIMGNVVAAEVGQNSARPAAIYGGLLPETGAMTINKWLDPNKVNVNGGAIGHPIGTTGARILATLIYEMIHRNVHRGIAALCLGGGHRVAMPVER